MHQFRRNKVFDEFPHRMNRSCAVRGDLNWFYGLVYALFTVIWSNTIVLLADIPPTQKVVRLFSKQNLGLYTGAASASSSQTWDIPLPFRGSCLRRRSNECSSYHLIGVAVHIPHLFSAVIFFPILFSFLSSALCASESLSLSIIGSVGYWAVLFFHFISIFLSFFSCPSSTSFLMVISRPISYLSLTKLWIQCLTLVVFGLNISFLVSLRLLCWVNYV